MMSKENAQEFCYMWNIHNFSFAFYKIGEAIKSPIFEIESFGGSQWCLKLYPQGESEAHKDHMSIYLYKKKNDIYSEVSSLIYEVEFIGNDGKSSGKVTRSNYDYKLNGRDGSSRWALISNVSNYLVNKWPENVLTLRCRMFNTRKQRSLDLEMHTEVPMNRSLFLWNVKISDISSQRREFSFSEKSLYEITLKIPDGVEDIKICISQKKEVSLLPKFVECEISLENLKKKVSTSKRASHIFETNDESQVWEFPTFIKKEDLSIYENGIFSLFCEIVSSDGMKSTPIISSTNEDSRTVLFEDLKILLHNHIHSDIKLKTDTEVIQAHKSILAARSPVFSAMFDQDMIESQTGIVDVPDIEANDLKLFLQFIYTGTVESFDCDMAKKLLVVADKYQVQTLTEKCVSFLEAILSLRNVIEVLSVADIISHKRLKNAAMNFIATNSLVIFKTPEWQNLILENVKLAGEMISFIAANFKVVPNN